MYNNKDGHMQHYLSYQLDRIQNRSHRSAAKNVKPSTTIQTGNVSHQIKLTIIIDWCTSLSFSDLTARSSTRPTALRTLSSSENHSSCTLLTLLHCQIFSSDTCPYVIYRNGNFTISVIWYFVIC